MRTMREHVDPLCLLLIPKNYMIPAILGVMALQLCNQLVFGTRRG
jgi:hypothetical protein